MSPLLTGSTDTIPMDVEGRRSARAVGVVAPLAETVTLMGRNPNGLWSLPKTVRVAVVRSHTPVVKILLPNRTRGMLACLLASVSVSAFPIRGGMVGGRRHSGLSGLGLL